MGLGHGHTHACFGADAEYDDYTDDGPLSQAVDDRARLVLAAVLVPLALLTVLGLVLLWPSGDPRPVPQQFTTFGEGRTVYVSGPIVAAAERPCGPAAADGTAIDPTAPTCLALQVRLDDGTLAPVVLGPERRAAFDLGVGTDVRLARGPVDPGTNAASYELQDVDRTVPLAWLALGFAVLVVLVARWRGLAALLGLGVAYAVLVAFLLPALLDGRSPVAVGLVSAAAILFVVLYLVHGPNARTSCALLGTLLALCCTAGLAAFASSAASLTGLADDASGVLAGSAASTGALSTSGLLLCGIVVGSLGVLNDVTITQASAVWEIDAVDPDAGPRRLFLGGMRVGRDHIASTVYTLVLAYAGAALPVLLLFSLSGRGLGDILTGEEIGQEIVRSVVGGAGLVLAVPLTTAVAALTVSRRRGQELVGIDRP
jgi:uncharacterized membrane protein